MDFLTNVNHIYDYIIVNNEWLWIIVGFLLTVIILFKNGDNKMYTEKEVKKFIKKFVKKESRRKSIRMIATLLIMVFAWKWWESRKAKKEKVLNEKSSQS